MRRTLLAVTATVLSILGVVTAVSAEATARTCLAGYRIPHVGEFRAAATIFVPSVTCDPNVEQRVFLGVGDQPSLGEQRFLAGVLLLCDHGSLQPFRYMGSSGGNVIGGDGLGRSRLTIVLTPNRLNVESSDGTGDALNRLRMRVRHNGVPDGALTFGAFPYLRDDGTAYPVPDFGTVIFRGGLLGEAPLSALSPQKLVRRDAGAVRIYPTGFTANGSFRLKWSG